ncbi:hypothetical protein [Pedobacter frigoris]|uniref:hypothetical protein n=1 Tax=Pedobacter frigoris TaxID=2571272 RepID=UPI002930A315|nr:hypothetical protein [Pedobacter frigoris]
MKKINIQILLTTTISLLLLTAVSLIAAGTVDEGTDGGSLWVLAFSKLFYILRFPTHPLFWNIMGDSGWFVFLGLLAVNALIYGFLIERLLSYFKYGKR